MTNNLDKDPNQLEGKDKKKQKPQVSILIALVEQNCVLFHNQFNEAYVQTLNSPREIYRLRSREFEDWLCDKFWDLKQNTPHNNAILSVLKVLDRKARSEGQQINVENRVGAVGKDPIVYDLSNKEWQAIVVTPTGWEITDNSPVYFRRYSHQKPQTLPNKDQGDLEVFLDFVNLAKSEYKLLLLVYLVSSFIPDIPHPIPILYGPQGAAKTTVARMLRELIDPSVITTLAMPNNLKDLVQLISHQWFVFFDNVTYISDLISNALCRVVTKEGFVKRELFTNDDVVIFCFSHCVGINGINLVSRKPDLLDRAILFKLERIRENQRKSEQEIWTDFENKKSIILGGIFNVLSKAMKIHPTINSKKLPRMADFAIWGCAITEALGKSKEEFLKVYNQNISEQHEEAIHESLVASTIMSFIKDKKKWKGSPSSLHKELSAMAEKAGWPKSVSMLSRRINEVKTNLEAKGILIEFERGKDGERSIKIEKH